MYLHHPVTLVCVRERSLRLYSPPAHSTPPPPEVAGSMLNLALQYSTEVFQRSYLNRLLRPCDLA